MLQPGEEFDLGFLVAVYGKHKSTQENKRIVITLNTTDLSLHVIFFIRASDSHFPSENAPR